jgi:uncharacterized protein (DUF2267 family)
MSVNGLDVFDTTVHQTNQWLKQIAEELHTDSRHQAYLALKGTLHALRDNLVVDEAADLAAQLPMLVRGIYYEGWNPSKVPVRDRHRDAFLERVGHAFNRSQPNGVYPEPAVRAVFKTLASHVSAGEIEEVRNSLPKEIRALWQ